MGDHYPKTKVGVLQAAPIFLDRESSTEKAVHFIHEAGQKGISLLAFPEGFIPAHPVWYHFQPATCSESLALAAELFKNSVEIPGPTTEALCQAASHAKVGVVIGVCEKLPRTTGTMFNTQIFIDQNGVLLGKHQKLMPTVGERLVHAGGFGDSLRVFQMGAARVSGLLCAENSNPLALFAVMAQNTQIHVAAWPNHFPRHRLRLPDLVMFVGRSVAYSCSCFVLNACGIVSDRMREMVSSTAEDRSFLADPEVGGGSSIIGPSSTLLAGPMKGNEEGIVEAEINLEDCVKKKIIQDFAGHYNRPDVFSLRVNTSVPKIFQFEGSDPSLPEEEARSRKGFQEGEKPDPNTNSQKS